MWICPVCGGALRQEERTLLCEKRHAFDLAAQGYVNLLMSNKKSSPNPGDNAEMVAGRTRFLDSGSYETLSDALNETMVQLAGTAPHILDAGCGEGYYAARLLTALGNAEKTPELYGIDLSKPAVRHAAARTHTGRFSVASLFELPIAAESMDFCYNVFSPLCPQEFSRVLAPDGHFIAAYPAARHLYGLKEVLYDAPYENEEKTFVLDGFSICGQRRISYTFTLEGNALIESLFSMTPYYYKTPIEGAKRLSNCEHLTTEADFWLITYKKAGD